MTTNAYHGYKSTKFLIAMTTLCFGTIGLFTGHIADTVWASAVVGVVLLYIGGNVGARFTEMKMTNGKGGQV